MHIRYIICRDAHPKRTRAQREEGVENQNTHHTQISLNKHKLGEPLVYLKPVEQILYSATVPIKKIVATESIFLVHNGLFLCGPLFFLIRINSGGLRGGSRSPPDRRESKRPSQTPIRQKMKERSGACLFQHTHHKSETQHKLEPFCTSRLHPH